MLKRIIITELCFLALVWLYFFPLWERLHEFMFVNTVVWWVIVFFCLIYLPWYRRSYLFFARNELTTSQRVVVIVALWLWVSLFAGLYMGLFMPENILWWVALVSAIAISLGIIILLTKQHSRSSNSEKYSEKHSE